MKWLPVCLFHGALPFAKLILAAVGWDDWQAGLTNKTSLIRHPNLTMYLNKSCKRKLSDFAVLFVHEAVLRASALVS